MSGSGLDHATLQRVAEGLHQDLSRLNGACELTLGTLKRFVRESAVPLELKNVDEELVAWVMVRFGEDQERLFGFLKDLLDRRSSEEQDLFGWAPPNRIDPEPEAERFLDRIDLSLAYIGRSLQIALPPELKGAVRSGYSIRNGQLDMRRSIQRALSFAKAAREVLIPT